MKKNTTILTLAAAVVLAVTVVTLTAGKVPLAWDDTNPPGTVKEYRLYSTKGELTTNETGEVSFLVTNRVLLATVPFAGETERIKGAVEVPAGQHRIVVTARNNAGLESDDSEPLVVDMPDRPGRATIDIPVTVPGD